MLVFNLEEALRLSSLPGENEGRAYYFRRLHLAGLPESGGRSRVWLEALQMALLEQAQNALCASDPAARGANAVYFRNEQEACQALIWRIVQRRPLDAWFWPAISGSRADANAAVQLVRTISKLSHSAASWMAVGAAVFAMGDPLALVALLPDGVAQGWLGEMGNAQAPPSTPPAVQLPETARILVARAAAILGGDDSRAVWLTALAVMLASPAEMDRGTAVLFSRHILRAVQTANLPSLPAQISETRNDEQILNGVTSWETRWEMKSVKPSEMEADSQIVARDKEGSARALMEAVGTRAHQNRYLPEATRPGAKTHGAGLYFLLNALTRLGIGNLDVNLPLLAHGFRFLARHAGIDDDDPILIWARLTLEEDNPYQSDTDSRQLRMWTWKVRRWCWRNSRIAVRQIVRRPGIVMLTRTDLDVSLSLDSVDIRIRRAGLDLDPGWLPWFGRVVRFHYLNRGELE
jgi:hypothetical protein